MTSTTLTLPATGLLDAALTCQDGYLVTAVPMVTVACGLAVFPRPRIQTDEVGEATAVVLDLRAWLVSVAEGVTLPAAFTSSQAATAAAETLAGHLAHERGSAYDRDFLVEWVRWWCGHHDDAVPMEFGGWSW